MCAGMRPMYLSIIMSVALRSALVFFFFLPLQRLCRVRRVGTVVIGTYNTIFTSEKKNRKKNRFPRATRVSLVMVHIARRPVAIHTYKYITNIIGIMHPFPIYTKGVKHVNIYVVGPMCNIIMYAIRRIYSRQVCI